MLINQKDQTLGPQLTKCIVKKEEWKTRIALYLHILSHIGTKCASIGTKQTHWITVAKNVTHTASRDNHNSHEVTFIHLCVLTL